MIFDPIMLQINSTTDVVPAILTQAQNSGDPSLALTSLILTAIGVPSVAALSKYLDKKAEKENEQNEFRLKAVANTLTHENESLKATDEANLDNARLLKQLKDDILKDGKPSEQTAEQIEQNYRDCKADIENYYLKTGLPKDDFDTCSDPIVKQVNAVKQKTIKND